MITVGTTLAAFVMDNEDHWGSWMKNAEQVKERYQQFGDWTDVTYFAAIQVDARGLEPLKPFLPDEDQDKVLPYISETVTITLLNVAFTKALPWTSVTTFFFTFFFATFVCLKV